MEGIQQSDIAHEITSQTFLSAADCNAQQEMSLPLQVQCIIDMATSHANILGIGFDRMLDINAAWVLSRLSIEMTRMPRVNENYSITTWIESVNRHYSERNFQFEDGEGNVIGYARTIWVAIDLNTRRPADLSQVFVGIPINDRPCPIEKFPRLQRIAKPDLVTSDRFRFSDIDFNRHVNSTRYIEHMLNRWDVEFFDRNRISRFDITYIAEAHCGDEFEVQSAGSDDVQELEIVRDGGICTRARFCFAPRTEAAE